jgi:hypothetical protein
VCNGKMLWAREPPGVGNRVDGADASSNAALNESLAITVPTREPQPKKKQNNQEQRVRVGGRNASSIVPARSWLPV